MSSIFLRYLYRKFENTDSAVSLTHRREENLIIVIREYLAMLNNIYLVFPLKATEVIVQLRTVTTDSAVSLTPAESER